MLEYRNLAYERATGKPGYFKVNGVFLIKYRNERHECGQAGAVQSHFYTGYAPVPSYYGEIPREVRQVWQQDFHCGFHRVYTGDLNTVCFTCMLYLQYPSSSCSEVGYILPILERLHHDLYKLRFDSLRQII